MYISCNRTYIRMPNVCKTLKTELKTFILQQDNSLIKSQKFYILKVNSFIICSMYIRHKWLYTKWAFNGFIKNIVYLFLYVNFYFKRITSRVFNYFLSIRNSTLYGNVLQPFFIHN